MRISLLSSSASELLHFLYPVPVTFTFYFFFVQSSRFVTQEARSSSARDSLRCPFQDAQSRILFKASPAGLKESLFPFNRCNIHPVDRAFKFHSLISLLGTLRQRELRPLRRLESNSSDAFNSLIRESSKRLRSFVVSFLTCLTSQRMIPCKLRISCSSSVTAASHDFCPKCQACRVQIQSRPRSRDHYHCKDIVSKIDDPGMSRNSLGPGFHRSRRGTERQES